MASYIAMDFLDGYRTKGHDGKNGKTKLHVGGLVAGLHGDHTHLVIIRLPHNWVLKFVTRVVLLAFVLISLPWLGSMIGELASTFQGSNASLDADQLAIDPVNADMLPLIFRDFTNEGLLRMGDRALFFSNGFEDEEAIYNCQALQANRMDVISHSDSGRKGMIPDETFDFIFVHGNHADLEFIDRVLKASGIVVVHLGNNLKVSFQKPSNYKIVYVRQFHSTIMAMRKTSCTDIDDKSSSSPNSPTQRRLLGLTPEAKKAALKKLEDVLLEPPRAASGKSNRYLKKTRYLPDLMGDSLESYPRRVFINVAGDAGWFAKHYPTRNKNFEIYEVETVVPETTTTTSSKATTSTKEEVVAQVPHEMSDWLRKTVKEEEYVVMKAEAEVVEEMVRSKTINLVDELFLECKHQGIKGKKSSRRPYWECLALYGILRDEGVAVHQWWG